MINNYCTDFGYESLESASCPHTGNLFDEDNSDLVSKTLQSKYHTSVCRALYLSKRTRVDILLDVSHHSSKVTCTTEKNLAQLKQMMSYVQTELYRGVVFKGGGNLTPEVYGDSGFMVHSDCRSRGGTISTMCGGAVGGYSTKQTILAKSSTEAELVELNTASGKAVEMGRFLAGFGDPVVAIPVYQDNKSVLTMIKTGKPTSTRTKHIAMQYFSVIEYEKDGKVTFVWVRTEDMMADILTKALVGWVFRRFRDVLAPRLTYG
jgi:hypothetical protein